MVNHSPVRVWQEREGEILWKCSCGAVNCNIVTFDCKSDQKPKKMPKRVTRYVSEM